MSALKDERARASALRQTKQRRVSGDRRKLVAALHDALSASVLASYTQGFALFDAARAAYGYDLKSAEIAGIWRGGCIIRSALLEKIRSAFTANANLGNLMLAQDFSNLLRKLEGNWRLVLSRAKNAGIPTPAMDASLNYYDSYRRERLPANLIQGIRDYFGAHGYERTDKPGSFHTDWHP
jgi:6-phosphogluconate dehydrogenase